MFVLLFLWHPAHGEVSHLCAVTSFLPWDVPQEFLGVLFQGKNQLLLPQALGEGFYIWIVFFISIAQAIFVQEIYVGLVALQIYWYGWSLTSSSSFLVTDDA